MESGSPFSTSGKAVKNCIKEPKVGDGFENNPWSVEDASAFLKYCCPECDYQILNLEMFSRHALQNHVKSKEMFRIGKYDEKLTNYEEIVINCEENQTNYEETVINCEENQTNYENDLEIQTVNDFPLQSEEMETDPFIKNYKIQLPESKEDVENKKIFHQEPTKPIIKRCKISNVPKGKKEIGVKCELCFSEFASKKELILHKLQKHQVGKDKCCVYCDFKHTSWLKLGNHIDSFHPEYAEPTYFCQICGKGFIFEENWQYHETQLHKTNRCNVCNIDCLDRNKLMFCSKSS